MDTLSHMPLLEIQRRMAGAILTGKSVALDGMLAAGRADPLGRLAIYRNNTFASLTEGLMTTFPATTNLVDPRFFRYLADAFIRAQPPREPRLAAYGASFPAFLSRFPAASGLPYLADVARLEWMLSAAGQVPELDCATSEILAGVSGDASVGLVLQPSLRFVLSRWRIDALWEANRRGPAAETFELARRPTRLQLRRRGDEVAIAALTPAAFGFRRALAAGRSLEAAAMLAIGCDAHFDLPAEILALFRAGLVIGTRP